MSSNSLNTLIKLCRSGKIYEIKQLLTGSKHIDLNKNNEFGMTPLLAACQADSHNIIKILLDRGANPNVIDSETGKNCLMFSKKKENLRLLLKSGADPFHRDYKGNDVLYYHKPSQTYGPENMKFLENYQIQIIKQIIYELTEIPPEIGSLIGEYIL